MAVRHSAGAQVKSASDELLPTGAYPVARWYRETPNATAVIENGVSYSYATLATCIVKTAGILMAAGLRPDMIIGIQGDVRFMTLVLTLASELAGATHVSLTEQELDPFSEVVERCDFVCAEAWNDRLSRLPHAIRISPEFVNDMLSRAEADTGVALLERSWPAHGLGRIGRTSGTTGQPRPIGHSRRALKHSVDIVPHALKFSEPHYNFISLYPFNLFATYTDSLLALRYGATVIYSTGQSLAADIRSLPFCHTSLMVGDAAALSRTARSRTGRLDNCFIRVIGGFVSPELRAALRESVTREILTTYSTYEVGRISADDADGPCTLLPDASVRIVGDDGGDLPVGQSGIVMLRTPWMADRYLWDDALTARHFIDGWFRTNDVGVMPEPGKLIVLGRADEMLIIGGLKIAPHPIEEQMRAIDGVTDAVLLSRDDAQGTTPLQVVIERGDPARDRELEARVVGPLVGHVTRFELHFVDSMPRTATGKVRRTALKLSLEGRPEPGSVR
jgi:AMP-binding enzyme